MQRSDRLGWYNHYGSEEKANETVNEIKAKGGEAIAVKGNMTRSEDVKKLVKASEEFGKEIHILINVTGGLVARKTLEELVDLCYPYLPSINAKGEPFEDESVEMTMMLVQQLIIKALKEENLKTENLMEVMRQVISTIDHIDAELQSVRNLINEAITNKKTTEPTSEFQSGLEVK